MQDTITRNLHGLAVPGDQIVMQRIMMAVANDASQSLTSAGLVINAGASPLVKTGAAAWYGVANGITVSLAAGTALPALVGTVVNGTFNVYAFFIDSAGNVTSQIGTPGATLALMKYPPTPQNQTLIGFIIIHPTGTGNFVGGTTALDDATVVPNTVYVPIIGAFDTTVLF